MKALFEALYGLVKADMVFARFLLPHIILEALIEDNSDLVEKVDIFSNCFYFSFSFSLFLLLFIPFY